MSARARAVRLAAPPSHAAPSDTVPPFLITQHGSAHAWRALKRRQIRDAIKALDAVRSGCAFLPLGHPLVSRAMEALEELRRNCTVKAWRP